MPLHLLQDASYTVTGLVDQRGAALEQYRYDAYGRVSEVTTPMAWEWPSSLGHWPSNHRRNAVGHQGLFFDRLEATGPATTDGLGAGGRQLVAEAWPSVGGTTPTASSPRGLYQNRNRTLDPVLGRFLQRDPNASGAVVAAIGQEGEPLSASSAAIDVNRRLVDGQSVHQYVRPNPIEGQDPLGLWMWGDWTDTLLTGAAAGGVAHAVVETHHAK